ncbi:MAG: leucyl aminopeptidase family protein [Candidatus Omnitrophica bacterium]|nr:leucyl aminopeptidase family protein [Candidatus Omnitrophota bacterium]
MNEKQAVEYCKRLVNMPYNKFNLGNYKEKLSKLLKIKINFIESKSSGPIKLMSGQHKNAGIISSDRCTTRKRKVILIGKGILFDAGGYDMKPSGKYANMKIDMAGMASAFSVASQLVNRNLVVYCPVSTNLVANSQILPGDEIKIGDKVVVISNTDAEGRLILAEALASVPQTSKDIIITVATLTNMVGYAIGEKATGVFTLNDDLYQKYKMSSDKAKELMWRLPLWEYLDKKYFKRKRIKNSVDDKPGASLAALFLKQFVKYPDNWIHLDIAYSCWDKKKERATGQPVRALINFINTL